MSGRDVLEPVGALILLPGFGRHSRHRVRLVSEEALENSPMLGVNCDNRDSVHGLMKVA
jgi:hypothetical protein